MLNCTNNGPLTTTDRNWRSVIQGKWVQRNECKRGCWKMTNALIQLQNWVVHLSTRDSYINVSGCMWISIRSVSLHHLYRFTVNDACWILFAKCASVVSCNSSKRLCIAYMWARNPWRRFFCMAQAFAHRVTSTYPEARNKIIKQSETTTL